LSQDLDEGSRRCICASVFGSGVFHRVGLEVVDANEIESQSPNLVTDDNDTVKKYASKAEIVRIGTKRDFLENVFTCYIRDHFATTNEVRLFYLSKEYNVNLDFDFQTYPSSAGRFILRKDTSMYGQGRLILLDLAEEPAKVIEDRLIIVENRYLHSRIINKQIGKPTEYVHMSYSILSLHRKT